LQPTHLLSNHQCTFIIVGEIYNTVLAVYSHEGDKPLPQSDEVLLCTLHTTLDMVNFDPVLTNITISKTGY
jgi:hypothetical protein